jgi:hypothetical protein
MVWLWYLWVCQKTMDMDRRAEDIPVRDGEYDLLVILTLVRILRVIDNQRAPEAIWVLSHVVTVICKSMSMRASVL